MIKLTDMCATARRNVARKHRTDATLARVELDKVVGFTPRYVALKAKLTYHTTQAKLWEAAAAQAEMAGFVSVQ